LQSNNLQSSVTVILQALKGISNLDKLDLGSNNMTGKVVDDLAVVIKKYLYLKELYLDGNNLRLSSVVILQELKTIFNLRKLNLNSYNMSGKVVDDLVDVIKNNSSL